jgi:hypothetical protein
MNPLDAAWSILKGTEGDLDDKKNIERQQAEWANIQSQEGRDEQQRLIDDDRGFSDEDWKAAHKDKMAAMADELARLEAENAAFREKVNPTPVDEEPVVD